MHSVSTADRYWPRRIKCRCGQVHAGAPHDDAGQFSPQRQATHFLTKTLRRVSTEMSLHVLAYNLKRVMKALGIVPLMKAMQA
jgi:hypothetical protein